MLETGSRCAKILTPWDSERGKNKLAHLAYATNISSSAMVMERKLGCSDGGSQRAEVPRNRRSQRYIVEEEAMWADYWESGFSAEISERGDTAQDFPLGCSWLCSLEVPEASDAMQLHQGFPITSFPGPGRIMNMPQSPDPYMEMSPMQQNKRLDL